MEPEYYPVMIRRMRLETVEKYGVSRKGLSSDLLKQLDRCTDDANRRLILGVNEDGSKK